ncbi:MAG TPA: glucose 1-dehydrogenase [Steroidobacteraceae bacterium]|jgi:NAD(P)-dependent dehydrogenase (short-subunit alcohol dehydrogenase family)
MKKDLAQLYQLGGKTAVVTGAARGIGKAVADLLASAGANVVVADILAPTAEATAAEIRSEGGKALAFAVDISEESAVKAMYDAAQKQFNSVDILVHCAAMFPKYPLLDITVEQWDRIQAVNLRGTMLVMREAIRRMRDGAKGGAIVNISSVSGEREVVFHNAAYGASKAGTTNLTRVAALEFGGDNIRVNAVLPGGTATEGAKEATEVMKKSGIELKGPMVQPGRMPLGGMGSPDDIAAACLFLVSPAARYITGQSLAVDGGFLVS